MKITTIPYKKGTKLKTGVLYSGDDGVYRYINNKLYTAISKVEQVFEGDKLEENLISINIPKIPYETFHKIHEFFKEIYRKYNSEVAILLWYNFSTDKWEVEVPKQTVTGATVNYKREEKITSKLETEGYLCVGTIHSHCEMSAFHSGTDDEDEYQFDGLHITIGRVISNPEYAQRYIIKNAAYKIENINDVVDMPEQEKSIVEKSWLKQVSKKTYKSNIKYQNFSNKNNFKDLTFDSSKDTLMSRYNVKTQKYECPLCFESFSSGKMDKNFLCPSCGFPMNEDEYEWNLDVDDNDKLQKAYKFEDENKKYDDYDQQILNEYYTTGHLGGNY